MGFMELGIILYVGIAVFAIVMTYREQCASGRKSPLFTAIGYIACMVWPLPVAALLWISPRSQT